MFKEEKDYFLIEEFEKYGVKAIFTKKSLGNMADYVNKDAYKNRKKVLEILNLKDKKIIHSLQKHTNKVKCFKEFEDNVEGIDGLITDNKDLVIFTYYADCLPIFILDKNRKAIGIAHSGWKGTYQEIIKILIETMVKNFDSKIDDILIALGIGISQEDYEVKEDFYNNFKEKFPDLYKECFLVNDNKYYYDNTKLNYLLAKKYGILSENIIVDNRGVLNANTFSYRLDKENIGRSAAIIAFKE